MTNLTMKLFDSANHKPIQIFDSKNSLNKQTFDNERCLTWKIIL